MQTVLITGGAGYIGSHAVKLFLKNGFHVVVFDNLSTGFIKPIKILKKYGRLDFVKGDLMIEKDIDSVFKKHKINGVLHFAARCSTDESIKHPELYFENNVCGSLNLFEAMRKYQVRRVIFSSTCAVYGEARHCPVDENHPQKPVNPYGESKLIAEKMLEWYGRIHKFHYIILRYFNVCGADSEGEIGDSKKPSVLLLQNAVLGALGIQPFFYTYAKTATPDGTPIRDYINVEDLARAHFLAYEYLKKDGASEIFNIGAGAPYSVKEIVKTVEDVCGARFKKQRGTRRCGEYAQIYANPKKAMLVLKWKPQMPLTDSITSLKKWYERFPHGYTS